MQQVTVGRKYQIVIPKQVRKKILGLKPGAKVIVRSMDNGAIAVKPVKSNWSDENYGALKKYWRSDVIKEVEKMRDEWEERVKKLEKAAS